MYFIFWWLALFHPARAAMYYLYYSAVVVVAIRIVFSWSGKHPSSHLYNLLEDTESHHW